MERVRETTASTGFDDVDCEERDENISFSVRARLEATRRPPRPSSASYEQPSRRSSPVAQSHHHSNHPFHELALSHLVRPAPVVCRGGRMTTCVRAAAISDAASSALSAPSALAAAAAA